MMSCYIMPKVKWNSKIYLAKTIMGGNNKKHIKFITPHWLNRSLKKGGNLFGKIIHPFENVRLRRNINHPKH